MPDPLKRITCALAITLASAATASAETLSTERIRAELIGHDLDGRMGLLRATLRYNTDGTVEMRAAVGRGAGTWVMSDTGLCVDITSGPRRGEECLTFTDTDDGAYAVSNGMVLTRK